jgi:hypothetical protein
MSDRMRFTHGAGIALSLVGSITLADGGDTPASAPTITGAQILAGHAIDGDTSDNTDFADSGTVPLTDCGVSTAPDEWYRLDIGGGTGTITVDIDACGSSYDSKVFVRDATTSPIACNDDGCGVVGAGSMLVSVTLDPGTYDLAFDGFMSAAGAYSAVLSEPVPVSCFLDRPCEGVDEGEPCDQVNPDTVNGGCNSKPEVFGTIEIDGPAVCGTGWAENGSRDTDWFAFEVTEVTPVEIEVHSETETIAFLAEMSDGGACPVAAIPEGVAAWSRDCDENVRLGEGFVLDPGFYILFVAITIFDYDGPFGGFPCPDGTLTNNAYEVVLRTAPGPPPPCPWDLNANGQVDFADILQVIANWGPCPTG